jgi:hypothetical protein
MQLLKFLTFLALAAGISAKCTARNGLCGGAFSFRCAINGDPNQARCCDTAQCVCESDDCLDV